MRSYRKPYKIKKKKSIFRSRFFWVVILVLIISVEAVYLICFNPYFRIEEIRIDGNNKVSTKELVDMVRGRTEKRMLFFSTKSIFLANLEKINKLILEEYPQIFEVKIKRIFPDILSLDVGERIPIGLWCQADRCFLIDKEGIIFDLFAEASAEAGESDDRIGKVIIKSETEESQIFLGKRVIKKDYSEKILEIEKNLKENLKIDIKEFIVFSEKLTVITREEWQIYFDLKSDILEQNFNLNLALQEKIPPENRRNLEYIDLRFGSKVYFRYK